MKKLLSIVLVAMLMTVAAAAGAGNVAPLPQPKQTVTFTQGPTSRTINALSNEVCLTYTGTVIQGRAGGCKAGSYVQFPRSGGDVTVHSSTQEICGALPPPLTRAQNCADTNPGTTGKWMQTATYAAAPWPACAVLGPYLPETAPEGACTQVPPPPPPQSGLAVDLGFVDTTSAEYADFIGQANRDDASALDLIYAYRLTGNPTYQDRAVDVVDTYFAAVAADISAGRDPDLAYDNYLYADGHILDLAMVYVYGNATAAQKQQWAAIADQTIFNIWHPGQARWGTRAAPWNGWATNDPDNNYHMHFMNATAAWALASGEQSLIDFMNNERWPFFDAAWAQNQGGGSLEGTGYGYAMWVIYDLYQYWRDSGRGDRGNATAQMANTIESWVHGTLPSLDLFVPIGDQARSSTPWVYDYQRALVEVAQYLTTNVTAKSDAGWWLSHIGLQHDDMDRHNYIADLFPYQRNAPAPAALTFRSPSVGLTTGRTAWTTDATFFSVLMGTLGQSHAHREQGGFVFYKRGWLSVTPNVFSHSGINQSYRSKNVLRFQKAGTVKEQDWATVNVSAYTANPSTGEFHITGDLTPLYQVGDNRGVNGWQRTVDFVAGVATITDTVNLSAGTTATFQLQVPSQPTITGNVITAGGLRATVLAPANPTITAVDMRGVSDDGDGSYPQGYRVEWACPGCKVKLEATN